jgi:sodium/potassium-transporting ATPase subunit alpha
MAKGREYKADEHNLSLQELAERFAPVGTAPHQYLNLDDAAKSGGISAEEAKRRLEEHGPNRLKPAKQLPEWAKYLLGFTNLFIVLLLIAAVLSFVAYGLQRTAQNVVLGGALVVVVVIIVTVTYVQQVRAP